MKSVRLLSDIERLKTDLKNIVSINPNRLISKMNEHENEEMNFQFI